VAQDENGNAQVTSDWTKAGIAMQFRQGGRRNVALMLTLDDFQDVSLRHNLT
jgi:hypothetical protein